MTLPDGKYGMRKLEELFDLSPSTTSNSDVVTIDETRTALAEIDDAIDKIDAALPSVRDLNTSDSELDKIATMATESFQNLSDLGMNIDSRYAAEIFAVASAMLGHALTAKTANLNKKLKVIELQLKKARLDQTATAEEPTETASGQVLSRNDLLERLIGNRDQKIKSV